jgi:hypothetical protein
MKSTLLLCCIAFFSISFSLNVNGQVPTISSISPTSGPVGSAVTITGTNFSPTPANNIVYFGAVKAIVTAATTTSLTVIVPVGATYKPISVTTGNLVGYSNKPFIVTFVNSNQAFTASSFSPKTDLPLGNTANSFTSGDVKTADFDGDGKPDLVVINNGGGAVVNGGGEVYVFRNVSFGNMLAFAPPAAFSTGTYSATTGSIPTGLAVDDLDGDGKLD